VLDDQGLGANEAWPTRTGIHAPVRKASDRRTIGLSGDRRLHVPPLEEELITILARAFDIAWSDYYGEARSGLLPEGTARSMLANYLVARAKEGTCDELTMAAAGLAHLISLTPAEMNDVSRGATTQPWKLNYKDANARFSNLWRARVRKSDAA